MSYVYISRMLKVRNNPAFKNYLFSLIECKKNLMIINKSDIFLVDQGVNRKKNGKLLQQWDTSTNGKNIRFYFLKLIIKCQVAFGTTFILFYTIM